MKHRPARRRTAKPESAVAQDALWAHHHAQFRDPQEIVVQWQGLAQIDPQLLDYQVRSPWWDLLAEAGITLVVTREYEHLVTAITVHRGRKRLSYLRLPHPNGLALDAKRCRLHVASTRNPNLVFDFAPSSGAVNRAGAGDERYRGLLLPIRSRYLPGSLYIHDLAMLRGQLHACAVGMNAVVRLPEEGGFEPVWWPRSGVSPGG